MTNPACRVTPIADLDQLTEQQQQIRSMLGRRGKAPKNIFRTLLRFPDFLKAMLPLAARAEASGLPAISRELIILRSAWRCNSEYEWAQHAETAAQIGMSETQINNIALAPQSPTWSSEELCVLQAVDDLFDRNVLSDATWQALKQHFDEKMIIDIIAVAGFYNMLAWQLRSLGVQLEPGQQGFPEALRRARLPA